MSLEKSARLKARLARAPSLVAPDAYDPLSARLIERAGFETVQCSGYSMALSLGYAAETNLSYSEALETTRRIVNAVSVPVMADGEDGFGDRHKLTQAIREFIAIGAAGINLEDQILGQWEGAGRAVVAAETMVEKLRLAQEVRRSTDNPAFVLNARTDALAAATDRQAGLNEAARRANLYLGVGGDLVFVTGVRTLAEARFLKERIDGPLSLAAGLPYNVHDLPLDALLDLAPARISLPAALVMTSVQAMADILAAIHRSGSLEGGVGERILAGATTAADLDR